MRDRAWRRYIEEKIVIKRLTLQVANNRWHYFTDINNKRVQHPMLKDYVNTNTCNMFKTYKTSKHDTKFKVKYSPNKSNTYYRYLGSKETREYDKIIFLKILKENGIK
jgi:hypothetical protein